MQPKKCGLQHRVNLRWQFTLAYMKGRIERTDVRTDSDVITMTKITRIDGLPIIHEPLYKIDSHLINIQTYCSC